MNKFIISLVMAGVLSVSYFAWAEDGISTDKPSVSPKPSLRAEVREQKDQLKQDAKDLKDKVKTEIKNVRTKTEVEIRDDRKKTEAEIKDAREQLKNNVEKEKIELKNKSEVVKEDMKKRKEDFNEAVKIKKEALKSEIETKREDLKVRLEKIKDERKKQTVEKIDQQIDDLNAKMMKQFSGVLDKLGELLIRVSERADKVSLERGLDVSAVRSSIDKANTAIASARSAVEVQSGKTYTIKVTTEKTLKADVGKARQALGSDLTKLRDAIKSAQSAVKDAAVALAQLVNKPKVSPSPTLESTPIQ